MAPANQDSFVRLVQIVARELSNFSREVLQTLRDTYGPWRGGSNAWESAFTYEGRHSKTDESDQVEALVSFTSREGMQLDLDRDVELADAVAEAMGRVMDGVPRRGHEGVPTPTRRFEHVSRYDDGETRSGLAAPEIWRDLNADRARAQQSLGAAFLFDAERKPSQRVGLEVAPSSSPSRAAVPAAKGNLGTRREPPSPWPEAEPGNSQHSEDFLTAGRIALWHASHIGPRYAKKQENQDATHAVRDSSRMFFALADGVSTAYGACFAARAAAALFCTELQTRLGEAAHRQVPSDVIRAEALKAAAKCVQSWLDEALAFLLHEADARQWNDVQGISTLAREVACRLGKNTLEPKNRHWGPVLATTLLGGMVAEHESGGLLVHTIGLGDGAMERAFSLADRSVERILSVDPNETVIASALSPGPLGRDAIEKLVAHQPIVLAGTDTLLISSDGLARGHATSVCEQLASVPGWSGVPFVDGRPSPSRLLERAAELADREHAQDPAKQLFDDNLSLILIGSSGSTRNKYVKA